MIKLIYDDYKSNDFIMDIIENSKKEFQDEINNTDVIQVIWNAKSNRIDLLRGFLINYKLPNEKYISFTATPNEASRIFSDDKLSFCDNYEPIKNIRKFLEIYNKTQIKED